MNKLKLLMNKLKLRVHRVDQKCIDTDGYWDTTEVENAKDIFFAPEKHEGWVNVYKCKSGFYTLGIYSDKEHAEKWAGTNCVATIKIEWEEKQ